MVRVKGGTTTKARHNKIRVANKGYRGKNRTTVAYGHQAWMKAGLHAYVGRKQKKRDMRALWITRLSTALRNMGEKWSVIKNGWLHSRMEIDRKALSEIAIQYPEVFKKLVEVSKNAPKIALSSDL